MPTVTIAVLTAQYTSSALLTWLIFLPVIGAALVMLLPPSRQYLARNLALAFSGGAVILACVAAGLLNWSARGPYGAAIQLKQSVLWIPSLNAHYFVGVDSLSMPLVLLTVGIGFFALLASAHVDKSPKSYFALMLLLLSGLLGVFLSLDLLLFYGFFEVSLVPMYFLIGMWGGPRKEYAAIKFFLYTLLGSICLLVVILGVYFYTRGLPGYPHGCLNLVQLATDPRIRQLFAAGGAGAHFASIAFWLLFAGFAIKLPALPLHSWLPDAHVEAPTAVSMVLAAVLLKMGGYGFLRVAYPLFPHQAIMFFLPVGIIAVAGIIYGGLCAMAQRDLKRLVAYSSISHMGYVLLGIAVMDAAGTSGSIFEMVAHGVSSAMMFFLVGVVYDRAHHRDIPRLGGLATQMPSYWGFSVLGFLASMGLPGLCGFIGEILVLFGTFQASQPGSILMQATHGQAFLPLVILGVVATLGILLTAAYYVWTLQRVFLGPPKAEYHHFPQLTGIEKLVLGPLGAAAVMLGVIPSLVLLSPMEPAIAAVIQMLRSAVG